MTQRQIAESTREQILFYHKTVPPDRFSFFPLPAHDAQKRARKQVAYPTASALGNVRPPRRSMSGMVQPVPGYDPEEKGAGQIPRFVAPLTDCASIVSRVFGE